MQAKAGQRWLEVLALVAWGILVVKYWLTGKLYILIHPNYGILTVIAAWLLLGMAAAKTVLLLRQGRPDPVAHTTLLPPAWGSGLLLGTALLGMLIAPRPFTSQTALERGVIDSLPITRLNPQVFRGSSRTEERSLVEWVRTLAVYPEPDAYTDQRVRVQGFVIVPPELPQTHFLIGRFIITCCAADAYPVSLPVNANRSPYKPDQWLEIEGRMRTETLLGRRQLVIAASKLTPIPEPRNPYDY